MKIFSETSGFIARVFLVMCLSVAGTVHSAEHWISGSISNITTVVGGVLIMMDAGVPTNCQGTPHGWMLVKEENKAMVAMVMAMWLSGRTGAVVYTDGLGSGYCVVNQIDPGS